MGRRRHPARRVAYDTQVQAGLVRRSSGPAFVAADAKPITPAKVEILPPDKMPDTGAPPAKVQNVTTGSHIDRAQGFSHVTGRLALTMGGLGVLVAIVGFSVPLFSLAVLAWFGGLYVATWLIAYLLHVFVSAEGAAWTDVRKGWRWLDKEQSHRHELERHANGLDRRGRR